MVDRSLSLQGAGKQVQGRHGQIEIALHERHTIMERTTDRRRSRASFAVLVRAFLCFVPLAFSVRVPLRVWSFLVVGCARWVLARGLLVSAAVAAAAAAAVVVVVVGCLVARLVAPVLVWWAVCVGVVDAPGALTV